MKTYNSIDYLPIFNYFKCAEGDLRYLYKTNDYDFEYKIKQKDVETFEKINDQFEEKIQSTESKNQREKIAHIMRLQKTHSDLQNFLLLLCVKPDDREIIEEVNKMGYNYSFTTYENAEKELKRLRGGLSNLENKIFEKTKDLNEITEKKIDIFEIIGNIEKVMQIPINPHKVTTSQFIAYIKLLKTQQN